MAKLSKTQQDALEKLRKAGAETKPVDWRSEGLQEKTVQSLACQGLLSPPAGEFEWYQQRIGYYGRTRSTARLTATVRLTEKAAEAAGEDEGKQTCPCCFRLMVVKKGRVVRHGWREAGSRRQGQYGNAWHYGSCFGVGYEPYEVSCQGTKDFHKALVARREDMQKGLETLQARPAELHCSYKKGYSYNAETVHVTLKDDGKALDAVDWRDRPMSHGNYDQPAGTYAYNLKNRIVEAERALKAIDHDIATLDKAIKEWKPKAA